MTQGVFDFATAASYAQARRILVCGSRWLGGEHATLVLGELHHCRPGTVIVHGGASGADRLAGSAAHVLGLVVCEYKADWARLGRSAGPTRNTIMLESGVDLVVAFWDGVSPGTRDTLTKARAMGIPCRVVGVDR